jgi:chemotaxis protein histidine kinase CheA/ActR/RegA family two-component response regulator
MSNTFDKLSVLDSFIEEVNSYLPEIETNLERLAQSPGDMDALEETYRRTHTIGGSASMMDFPGLAHVAHGMEDILGDALDGLMTLDDPTRGLLQRSLGRLRQLLEGIRGGIDEEAVIAEDDADYAGYRALIDNASTPAASGAADVHATNSSQAQAVSSPFSPVSSFNMPTPNSPLASSMPSFDEVLASFRTQPTIPGEDIGWPEEPELGTRFDNTSSMSAIPAIQPIPGPIEIPEPEVWSTLPVQETPTSAFEALMASTRRPPEPTPAPPEVSPSRMNFSDYDSVEQPFVPTPAAFSSSNNWNAGDDQPYSSQMPALIPSERQEVALPQAHADIQLEVQSLGAQASSLKSVALQLRDAMTVIEVQRSEFKGFLNGSKDALDRMEEWAGKAMGLNLRNSPEQVRRYLPLSVMWVSNTKLKKVFDLIQKITGGVELTDEQLAMSLEQLQSSLRSYGEAFEQYQGSNSQELRQENGWSPWNVRVDQDTNALRERVTFERQGDPAGLRAEVEAQVREEVRREYEAQMDAAARERSELERQIRDEVRQEFTERQIMQERAYNTDRLDTEGIRAIESRLRSEIEIQVRQEFLNQLSNTSDDPASPMVPPSPNGITHDGTGYVFGTSGLSTTIPSSNVTPTGPEATNSYAPAPAISMPVTRSTGKSTPASLFSSSDFGEEAAEIFRLEAEEHLQSIGVYVAALEKNPTNRELIQGIRRATHTLKGAAGMMGFKTIADLSHVSEDLLDLIMEGTMSISPTVVSLILDTAEALELLITGNDTAIADTKVRALHKRYVGLLGERSSSNQMMEEDLDDDDHTSDVIQSNVVGGEQASDGPAPRTRGDLSVRVRLLKLDELVNLFGEMLVNRSVLEERIQRLVRLVSDVAVSSNRLADVGQKLDSRFEAATLPSGRSVQVMPGEGDQRVARSGTGLLGANITLGLPAPKGAGSTFNHTTEHVPSHLSDFDELELDRYTEFHQLARGLNEGISDMATLSTEMDTIIRECEGVFARENRLNTTFQDRLMKVRLVPLSTMAPRLSLAARAVGIKQGKEIDFVLEGEATEVDRTVFEEVAGPLLHLVRNAVNHAIERPEIRIQRGKPPTGQIKLSAAYEGNQIMITVRDDGSGIDREQVRNTAIARGLIRADQQIGEDDIVSLIFQPGFSTAEVLSEESGRGVGLDVVRDSVSRLRGTLVVETAPGLGTAFTMTFPTSLAIQSAMMVRVGGQQFAIPTVHVESIGRLDNFKRTNSGGQPAVVVRNDLYPLHMLSQYLSLPTNPTIDDKAQMLLVHVGGRRVALAVDEIRGKFDIVMKNLGPHLREVHGIAGGTVLGNGHVVLVLELNSLLASKLNVMLPRREGTPPTGQMKQHIDVSNKQQGVPSLPAAVAMPIPERGKHILVVDDSPSVRRVVSNMLKQHGWTVQMARDGVEALEMISLETPAAVLLDIEMPRMDGYELISTVRAQEQYRTLPLVVLTSRAAAKHQQRAMSLGASAYVVKPYQDEELISTINSLVYGALAR